MAQSRNGVPVRAGDSHGDQEARIVRLLQASAVRFRAEDDSDGHGPLTLVGATLEALVAKCGGGPPLRVWRTPADLEPDDVTRVCDITGTEWVRDEAVWRCPQAAIACDWPRLLVDHGPVMESDPVLDRIAAGLHENTRRYSH
jgi:hypothetical protein